LYTGLAQFLPESSMKVYRLLAVMAAGTVAAGVGLRQWIRSHRATPEQREKARRQRLVQIGRICDGTVLDVQKISPNGHGPTYLIIYTYGVGGVSYEASQDITQLRQFIDIHSCKLGLPSSIKYDPHNPGNSIVLAEAWTGLRS
jgi:hypothetical protein